MKRFIVVLVALNLNTAAAQAEGAKFITVDEKEASAPRGYISITFDDATSSQYKHGFPVMQQLGLVGTLFVGTAGVENASQPGGDWAMTWTQVREFQQAGWEIGSHSHTHPDMTTLSDEAVVAELTQARELLQRRLGVEAVTYASPFGRYNDTVLRHVAAHHPYHMMAWGGNEGRNSLPVHDPLRLGRMDVAYTTTVETVCGEMVRAATEKTWTAFIFHRIVPGEPQEYEVSVDNFEKMMNCAQTLEEHGIIAVVTVNQAMVQLFEPLEQ